MKNYKIGLSCSPSKILSKEDFNCTKILISYGGGIGGASQTFYCINRTQTNNYFWALKLIDGRTVTINPKFVVSLEDGICVKVKADITAHSNYHSKVCESHITTRFYFIQKNETYIVDETSYTSDDNSAYLCTESELIK